MGLFIKDSGEGNFEPLAEATYMARCTRVIDCGTQHGSYKGAPTVAHKIMLTFELPTETITNKETGEIMPMTFSKEYTLSLGPKSNLRPVLESLRGKKFTDEEAKVGIDLAKVAGMPCSVEIYHKSGKEGKTYPNVGTVSGLLKGSTCPPATHEVFAYDIDEGRCEKFYKLPTWIQTKIMASSDWKGGGVEGDPAFEGISAAEQQKMNDLANPQEVPPPSDEDYMAIEEENLPF